VQERLDVKSKRMGHFKKIYWFFTKVFYLIFMSHLDIIKADRILWNLTKFL
jgi:hypothetical protein